MANLIPADRQKRITELIRERGVVRVNDLSKQFQVSVLTIRRDLDLLEENGVLERSHGGAVLRQTMPEEPMFAQKEQRFREQKHLIAAATAQYIQDGDMVLINSGTTTLEVIRQIIHKRITIITNNIAAAQLIDTASCDMIILGGKFRCQSQSTAGSFGLQSLQQVYANKAVIGVDGFSMKYGLTTPIMQEAEITRVMIEKTVGDVFVVADSNKMGVISNFKTVSVDKISHLVTDSGAKEFLSEIELEKAGIKLILADSQ